MTKKHLKAIKKNNNFIACSDSVAKTFKKYDNIDLNVIQNAVDTEEYKPAPAHEIASLRQELGLPENKKIFISVGVLIPRKNMSTIIKAFHSIQKEALLLLAGDGNEKEKLHILSSGNESIVFLGNISNVTSYLQASDVFISASLAEGLPNTVLEAMSCGLPVILSNIDPHQEIFGYKEEYPYFFGCQDTGKLAELLDRMLDENMKDLSKGIRNIILRMFSAQIMSKKYQALYTGLIKNI